AGLVLGAGLLAFVWALGDLAAPPRPGDLAAAAARAAGEAAGPHGSLALAIWSTGGAAALGWARWLAEFAGAWFLLAAVLLGVRRMGGRVLLGVGIGLALIGAGVLAWHVTSWSGRRADLRLLLPVSLVEAIPSGQGVVFANPSARPALALLGLGRGISPCPRDDARLAGDPSAWRARLREKRWPAVVLAGPAAEFRPLLEHLLASPDWRLERLSNSGWLFLRGGGPGAGVERQPAFGSDRHTALYHAQLAERLADSHDLVGARRSLKKALELAPRDALVHWHAARFFAARKEWSEAAEHARFAVRRGQAGAASLLARALLEKGDAEGARQAARLALRHFSQDPETHFLLARIERARNNPQAEAEALERAAAAAREAGLPAAAYLAYLGQARATLGDARRATKAYEEALAAGTLGPKERQAIEEALAIIRERTRLSEP
ncbi:MAG: hypothetical protein N2322_05320, partial [Terrimicrobiaceae bacterium]|nr:hypothetical protein [Terrimicrobiaceae bacterium]